MSPLGVETTLYTERKQQLRELMEETKSLEQTQNKLRSCTTVISQLISLS
jgi:hypothetical protein